jgi:hypothetical protein
MSENKVPEFDALDDLVEFFDSHDLGVYDLPEASFNVSIEKRTYLVPVGEQLMKKLSSAAKRNNTSTEDLVNAWLEERVNSAA